MSNKENLRPCFVKGKKSYFHKWSEVSKVVGPSPLTGEHGGIVRITVGIIEDAESGSISERYPYEIRFTDRNIGEPQEDISVV